MCRVLALKISLLPAVGVVPAACLGEGWKKGLATWLPYGVAGCEAANCGRGASLILPGSPSLPSKRAEGDVPCTIGFLGWACGGGALRYSALGIPKDGSLLGHMPEG